ncbi:MAG: hypothetical protein HAW63_03005 [Bdellovibrionaceae bacterium]|nr:hypothetical protein [Pseudobdellovibrionaceae bacterium]
MHFVLLRPYYLKALIFVFTLLVSFSLPAQVRMPVEGGKLDCAKQVVQNLQNNTDDIEEAINASRWTNTRGRIREITDDEIYSPLNAVGIIKCTDYKNYNFAATGTLVLRDKAPTILFAGHSTCNGKTRVPLESCVFQHTYVGNDKSRYGQVYEYKFKTRATNHQCGVPFEHDIAVATLEDFYGFWTSTVTITDSINKTRYIDRQGNIKYKAYNNNDHEDVSMLLVGRDRLYNKLMVSENCGLFDPSNTRTRWHDAKKNEIIHDCISSGGYSGGPIFQKSLNKKKGSYDYNLVCVHSGATYYSNKEHIYYRKLIKGHTGGSCYPIEKSEVNQLYKEAGAK